MQQGFQRLIMVALAGMILAGAPASAQDAAAGRYTMHPSDDGFVRLDTVTGAVAMCQKTNDKWQCVPMDGAVASDRSEIARLSKENEELRAEIKRLDDMLGLDRQPDGRRPDPPRPGGSNGQAFRLPSEKEVDQALDYFETMLRKFQERLKRLEQKQQPSQESKPL
jgi:hypothetical protein